MDIYIQLIFIIVLVKYCLKAALSNNYYIILAYAALTGFIAFASYPIVIQQPLTILSDMLTNRETVENIALLTSAESILGIFISIYLLDNYFKPKSKRTKFAFIIKIIPGLLWLCAIAYFELHFFNLRVGQEFMHTAILYALLLFATVFSLSFILKNIVNGESFKLEVKLILNLAILTLGLLLSSSIAHYNISNATLSIEWGAMIALIVLVAIFIIIGIYLPKLDLKKHFNTTKIKRF